MNKKNQIKFLGITGTLGALIILVADLVYNFWNGDQFGVTLYFTTYAGIFCFPLWWGGIWVIYQGLKPAGLKWSLYPCILFAYILSTVCTSGHASYPYWAAFDSMISSNQEIIVKAAETAKSTAFQYTGILLPIIQPALELIVCIWIIIPIARGKTLFNRWFILLIPITPTLALLGLNFIFPGIFDKISPYIGSGIMTITFAIATLIVLKHKSKEAL